MQQLLDLLWAGEQLMAGETQSVLTIDLDQMMENTTVMAKTMASSPYNVDPADSNLLHYYITLRGRRIHSTSWSSD